MKHRDHALDVVRILAIAMVVMQHASSTLTGMSRYAVGSLGNVGVPLFVMLTGYLMVDREYDGPYIQRFLARNLLPMFVALESWNLLWFLYGRATGRNVMTVGRMLRIASFMGSTQSAFWFLQMIFGVYLGLPIISIAVHHLTAQKAKAYMLLLAGCVVVFGAFIPTIQQFYEIFLHGEHPQSVISMNIFGSGAWGSSCWMLYLLAGYMVKRLRQSGAASRVPHIGSPWLGVAFLVSIGAFIWFNLIAVRHGGSWYPRYANLLLEVAVILLFMLLLRMPAVSRIGSRRAAGTVEVVSRLSFSIYMIHTCILSLAQPWLGHLIANAYLLFLCCFIVGYFGSLLVGWILSRNSILRKWLLLMK